MDINEIAELLSAAKEAYYNSDSPIMSDAEFDELEEKLRQLDPGHEYFSMVGAAASDADKIRHDVPMLSMMKGKNMEDIASWIKKISPAGSSDFIIEPKIDGLSATCRYRGGKLVYVATRGNGIEGQDISHAAGYIKDIPESIRFTDEDVEVRGELYLPRDTPFNTGGKVLRNACVGLVNRKEKRDDLAYVRFAAFRIVGIEEPAMEHERIDLLAGEGFNSVNYSLVSDAAGIESFYRRYIDTYRDEWEYETDGLIVCVNDRRLFDEIDSMWVVDHHNHYAIALKPPSEFRETPLNDIAWQVSRQGNIIPVAVFDPVFIGGARLTRASLNNYDNVLKLKIQKGDILIVQRANDVIPFIAENKSSRGRSDDDFDQSLLIGECPSCGSKPEKKGVHLQCVNSRCSEKNIQKIVYWVRNADIDYVAEATVRTLFERGRISAVRDLYTLEEKDFQGIEGFAEKKINNFLKGVRDSKRISSVDFISRLGIPLVQKKSLIKMGINSVDDFLSFNDDTYVMGRNIIEWKNDEENIRLFNELLEVLEIKDGEKNGTKGKAAMTGTGPGKRSDLIRKIEEMGFEFSPTVTRDLAVLICEDVNGKSSKLDNARKNNIKLMTYEDFFSGKNN